MNEASFAEGMQESVDEKGKGVGKNSLLLLEQQVTQHQFRLRIEEKEASAQGFESGFLNEIVLGVRNI